MTSTSRVKAARRALGPNRFALTPSRASLSGYVQEGIDPEIERYCDRHWVLKLAEIIETDMPICKHSLRDHVISTGELVGDTWEVRTEG